MPAKELAERLIGGITTSEVPVDAYTRLRGHIDPIRFVVPPLPEHAVHPRHHLLDLWRRQPESDVLAGAAPGDAAHVGASTSSTRASATPSSRSGSAIRTSTTARPRWKAAT